MTATLEKTRTASIIIDTDGDNFKIQHMFFDGDTFEAENNVHFPDAFTASVVSQYAVNLISARAHRPTSVFITVSAAKRMTDDMIAGIQAAALETRT